MNAIRGRVVAKRLAFFFAKVSRFFEIWEMFGPRDRLTWRTLFPPYKGWDVGCAYCAMEPEALKEGRCKRAEAFGYWQCGTTVKEAVK